MEDVSLSFGRARRYASAADAAMRLLAAWPPIFSGVVPAEDVPRLLEAASVNMMAARGTMTSELIEFSARKG